MRLPAVQEVGVGGWGRPALVPLAPADAAAGGDALNFIESAGSHGMVFTMQGGLALNVTSMVWYNAAAPS